jgi:hypothetical protein
MQTNLFTTRHTYCCHHLFLGAPFDLKSCCLWLTRLHDGFDLGCLWLHTVERHLDGLVVWSSSSNSGRAGQERSSTRGLLFLGADVLKGLRGLLNRFLVGQLSPAFANRIKFYK